ncbi:hypothetical protein HMI56_003631 [Coelomomyces lativittatus]|nr:hypothetical protein HMI56_003631 [Coelomomyces lativittatus]
MDKEYELARERVEMKHPGFSKLDNDLLSLSQHPPSKFTISLLSSIVQWKLWRGKFRPRLMTLVQSNKHVDQWSELIFKAPSGTPWSWTLSTIQKLVKELKGVGPATASAILSFFHESSLFLFIFIFIWFRCSCISRFNSRYSRTGTCAIYDM